MTQSRIAKRGASGRCRISHASFPLLAMMISWWCRRSCCSSFWKNTSSPGISILMRLFLLPRCFLAPDFPRKHLADGAPWAQLLPRSSDGAEHDPQEYGDYNSLCDL